MDLPPASETLSEGTTGRAILLGFSDGQKASSLTLLTLSEPSCGHYIAFSITVPKDRGT